MLSIVSKDVLERWDREELVFDLDSREFVEKIKVLEDENFRKIYPDIDDQDASTINYIINKYLEDNRYSYYFRFKLYDAIDTEYITAYDKDGNEVEVISIYV